jgi:hypothetical protein
MTDKQMKELPDTWFGAASPVEMIEYLKYEQRTIRKNYGKRVFWSIWNTLALIFFILMLMSTIHHNGDTLAIWCLVCLMEHDLGLKAELLKKGEVERRRCQALLNQVMPYARGGRWTCSSHI